MPAKVTVEKRLKRAGATRLFWGQAAQKVLRVAPALDGIAVGLFSTVKSRSEQSFMHALFKLACRKGDSAWRS